MYNIWCSRKQCASDASPYLAAVRTHIRLALCTINAIRDNIPTENNSSVVDGRITVWAYKGPGAKG